MAKSLSFAASCGFAKRSATRTASLVFAVLVVWAGPALSQNVFGKNKVVYASRDWRMFQEDKISLYFYEEEEEIARRSLAIALEAYKEFAVYFDFEFQNSIPIILYGSHHDFKQTNVIPSFIGDGTGGFTEFAKGRVTLPATGSYIELRHVIRHELVHAFMLAKIAKVMRDRGMYDYNLPPLWFVEGMAESVARRHPDTQGNMVMRDAALNNIIFPIPYLWQIAGSFLMYKHGESLLGYMRTQYGDRIPVQLLEAWWRGRSFQEVLQIELGLTEAELSRGWETYLKRRFYPQMLTRRDPDELGERILEKGGLETTLAVLGQNEEGGLDLAALSGRAGLIDLYLIEKPARGKAQLRRLVEGGRKARFESLPAFRSKLDTYGGRYITFVAKHGGRDKIYIYDVEEDRVAYDLTFKEVRQISSPAFDPTMSRVVFSGLGTDGYSDIYVANIHSKELARITNDPYEDNHPNWHPHLDRIVFASDRNDYEGGTHSLHMVDLTNSSRVMRLTGPGGDDDQPVWSPDGKSILYVSDRSGTYNLHILKEGQSTQITNVMGGVTDADWVSDTPSEVVASVYHAGRFSFYRFPVRIPEDPRGVLVLKEEITEPIADALPPIPMTEATDKDYQVSMGLDFVQAVVAMDPDFPDARGANIGFTDLLGDRQMFVHFSSASQDFSLRDINVGLSFSNLSRRWNRHFGVFRLSTSQRLSINRKAERIETRTGGFLGVTYPFSTYQRMDFTAVLRYLERGPSLNLGEKPGQAWTASGFVSYVHDNTLWTWGAGPIMGSRYNITVGRTWDLQGNGFDRFTVQFDARKYVPFFKRAVFATRFVTRHSYGGDIQFFYLGGPDDLRGYNRWQFAGEHTNLFNAEIRFPLLDRIHLRFPFADIQFPYIRGYLFSDTAKVGGRLDDTGVIGSLGYGVAMTLFPPLVLRVNFVRKTDYHQLFDQEVDWALSFLY